MGNGNVFDQMAENAQTKQAQPSVSIPQPVAPIVTPAPTNTNNDTTATVAGIPGVTVHGMTPEQANSYVRPATTDENNVFDQMAATKAQTPEPRNPIDDKKKIQDQSLMSRLWDKTVIGIGKAVPQAAAPAMAADRDLFEKTNKEIVDAFTEAGAAPAKAMEALKTLREKGIFNWNINNALATGGAYIPPGANTPQNPSDSEFEAATAADFPHLYGIGRGTGAIVGGLMTPENLALMVALPESKAYPIISKLLSTTFAAQMSQGSWQQLKNLAEHWDSFTPAQRSEAMTEALGSTGLATLATAHAAGEFKGEPKPKVSPETDKRTTLRPTTKTVAGVEAPIAAVQQESPSILTKVLAKTTTPGQAARFQEELTKPAAVRQAVSTLSQVATDKIAAHDALVAGEEAPAQITGTQTAGRHTTPDEIWKAMQDSANQTYGTARDISRNELAEWQKEFDAAAQEHKAAVDRHNGLVDIHNAELAPGEEPMEKLQFNPEDVDIREKPKTYDELKAELDAAKDRLGRNNPSDVREKAKTTDVPKAEKALDDWFKNHEDSISKAEYTSAKSLWADSERFKEIANNVRGKLAKGTLTGNDIRGLEALVDGKAIKRRGSAGIGEFDRLVGPEAKANLDEVAKLFDPLEPTDPRSGIIKSWGGYVAKHVVATMMAPILGIGYLGVEGLNAMNELFMNHVMFDPDFGKGFARFVEATKNAISAGAQVPRDIVNGFQQKLNGLVEKYRQSKLSSETGAVGAAVKQRKVGPRAGAKPLAAELSPNASGESSASQEAINRQASEKSKGVKRVVVDTRSGIERPLIGVDAVDYQPKPFESVEFRGGDRDGEIIDQGRSARPYTRKYAPQSHVAAAADEYAASVGRPAMDMSKKEIDPHREMVADAYDQMKHDPNDPKVREAYKALIDESKAQKKFLESRGYTFSQSAEDPYKSYEEMRDDVLNNKHLKVWTGGNPFPEGHPLGEIDSESGWRKNDILRGVHDVMGHVAGDNDFSEKGEQNAYQLHKQAFSEAAHPALATETKGQVAWFFNNKELREGRQAIGAFPDQKAGVLPEHFYSDDPVKSITSLTNTNGGATFSPTKGDLAGTDAYAVPMHPELSRTVKGDKVTPKQVADYMSIPEVKAALQGDHDLAIGTWAHGGQVFFDLSKAIPGRDEAIRLGKENNQKAITYLKNFEEIPLGKEGTGTPLQSQMVGTAEGAAKDTAYVAQAKAENPGGTVSQWLQRAQQLKEQAAGDRTASEITTRRPTSVKGDRSNIAGQSSNWDAVEQAERNNPSGVTALGKTKLGYKEKLARTVESYPGMPEVDTTKPRNPDAILSRFVNHVAGNLEWLYYQIDPEIRQRTRQWYDAANKLVEKKAKDYGYTPEQGAGVVAALSPQNPWDNNLGLADRTMDIYKNHQNVSFSPEMEMKAAELKKVPTQSKAFKGLLKDIDGKKLKDVRNDDPDVQAVQRALWIRLYDEAHGAPTNPQYAPTGEIVGDAGSKSWIGLDHLSKAVKILDDGSVENINDVMGQGHKIRNFYNNLINPMSKGGHVTIDTHAVAAGLMLPVGAKDLEATHNFGGTLKGTPGAPKDASTGIQGTYPLYTEAYQRVARKLGILPRELQSITWEGIKSLMGDEKKTPELKAEVKQIWQDVTDGKLTPEEARAKIKSAASGFSKPQWMSDEEWEKSGAEGDDTSFDPEGGQ